MFEFYSSIRESDKVARLRSDRAKNINRSQQDATAEEEARAQRDQRKGLRRSHKEEPVSGLLSSILRDNPMRVHYDL